MSNSYEATGTDRPPIISETAVDDENAPSVSFRPETGTRRILGRRTELHLSSLVDLDRIRSRRVQIERRWPDIVPTAREQDKDAILRDMLRRITEHDWADAKQAAVARAARVAFEYSFRTASEFERLRRFFIREIEASTSASFLSAMATIYLESYVPEADHTRALAKALQSRKDDLSPRTRSLARHAPEIVDPERGADRLGRRMAEMDHVYSGLEAIGFSRPHLPGILDYAHLAFVGAVRSQLHEEKEIERLLAWLKPTGREAKVSHAAEAIEALLLALEEGRTEEGLKIQTFKTLIDCYGDPRTTHRSAWLNVSDDAKAGILRWLTGANIRFFMDVISDVTESHMYEDRRRYWLSLYDRGLIDAAWGAFSDKGARRANQLRSNSGGESRGLAFGRQTAGGGRADTSLLIFRIGRCIVVEGSHSYKVQIFMRDSPQAPQLFQARYDCDAIRDRPKIEEVIHSRGAWQRKVSAIIEAHR